MLLQDVLGPRVHRGQKDGSAHRQTTSLRPQYESSAALSSSPTENPAVSKRVSVRAYGGSERDRLLPSNRQNRKCRPYLEEPDRRNSLVFFYIQLLRLKARVARSPSKTGD